MELSPEEMADYKAYKEEHRTRDDEGKLIIPKLGSLVDKKPNFIYKHDSLFPNHNISRLDIEEDAAWFEGILTNFKEVLKNPSTTERDLLRFICDKKGSFIISSLLRYTDFGHHERYIFPEFQLSNHYKVDFLILGRGSGGWRFLFIELENPNGSITTKDGSFSIAINKGIKQVKDWKRWLPGSFTSVRNTLEKYLGPNQNLSREFYHFDFDRMYFMVIAGMRDNYKELTYQLRRELNDNGERIKLFHYENIIDSTEELLRSKAW